MSNSHEVQDRWLVEMGGESLEESGFETETPDPVYSDDHAPGRLPSANEKEPNHVH